MAAILSVIVLGDESGYEQRWSSESEASCSRKPWSGARKKHQQHLLFLVFLLKQWILTTQLDPLRNGVSLQRVLLIKVADLRDLQQYIDH